MSVTGLHDFDDQPYDTKPGSDEPMHVRVLDRTAGLVITAIAFAAANVLVAHQGDTDAITIVSVDTLILGVFLVCVGIGHIARKLVGWL
jgi:hypothetical protein